MSYASGLSTDIDIAIHLAAFLVERWPEIPGYAWLLRGLREVQACYRRCDDWKGDLPGLLRLTGIPFRLATLERRHRAWLRAPVSYRQFNEVRYHNTRQCVGDARALILTFWNPNDDE